MRSITARLARLEAARPRLFADILALIDRRAYYDELTPEEQSRFCKYIGIDKQAFENVNRMVLGDCHVTLAKFDAPTQEELKQIQNDIQNYMEDQNNVKI